MSGFRIYCLKLLLACVLQILGSTASVADGNSAEVRFSTLLEAIQSHRTGKSKSGTDDVSQCPQSQWGAGEYSLFRGELERRFRVHVPASYDPQRPAPLVVAFHGWGGDDMEFLRHSAVRQELDARGVILIAPSGLGPEEPGRQPASWSFSGSTTGLDGDNVNTSVIDDTNAICDDDRTIDYTYPSCADVAANGCSWTHCNDDDRDYAVALVRAAKANLCVDEARVYAVGGSNGGMFSWDIGRELEAAQTFRAVASLIGLPHRGYLAPPVRVGGMPVLLVTGTNDPTVPPGNWGDKNFTTTTDGDVYYYTGASAISEVWAEAHGCDVSVPPSAVDVGIDNVDCRGWNGCSGDGRWPPVLDCRRDMTHIYGLEWSWALVLDFFEQHQ